MHVVLRNGIETAANFFATNQPSSTRMDSDKNADPFFERSDLRFSTRMQIMGGCFLFESTSEALVRVVNAAYGGLPEYLLPTTAGDFRIELRLLPRRISLTHAEPPPVQTMSGAGFVCGVMDASNYVLMAPEQRRALIVASEDMLDRPYHLRYELIEFAVFILTTRALGFVPLHGACVGRGGRGILLLGASGAGKSTLALHSLLEGLEFVAEDAIFVQPQNMLATGVANYLHVKSDALRFVEDHQARRWISEAPTIRRRSGVKKFEADLRQSPGHLAAAPMAIVGAVLVSSESADDPTRLLRRLPSSKIGAMLTEDQPYASRQPGWHPFEQRLTELGVYQLQRGRHPRDSVDALRDFLG